MDDFKILGSGYKSNFKRKINVKLFLSKKINLSSMLKKMPTH